MATQNKVPYDKVEFNGQLYAVRFLLGNTNGGIEVHHDRIQHLIINEDLNSIFPTAKLILDNTGNVLDQTPKVNFKNLSSKKLWTYAFNTDNRDMFIVDIFPTTEDFFESGNKEVFPDDVHRIFYEFVVYDEEEVPGDTRNGKYKIFYLRDAREQILTESKVQWSSYEAFSIVSETSAYNMNYSSSSNVDRSPYTGEAIKHFITKAFSSPGGDIISSKFDDWDKGSTKVFYSTSPNHSAYDSLEYLLDRHVSNSDQDNCILGVERTSMGAGHWFLRPLSKFFAKAVENGKIGEYTNDLFHVHSGGKPALFMPTSSENAEAGNNIPVKGYAQIARSSIVQQFNGMENFTFLNAPNGVGLDELVSTVTHGYNSSEHQFELDCSKTHVDEIRKKFKNLYVDNFNITGKPEAIFPTTEEKTTNRLINHVYSEGSTPSDRIKYGVNRVLSKALAYTPGIDFSTDGWPYRHPGRFMILLDSTIQPESSFEKIFSGEWFITRVVHSFSFAQKPTSYTQQIACIKPHSYAKLVSEE